MSKQVSPFAALTGAEKQIRWLEYQSIKLPYIDAPLDDETRTEAQTKESISQVAESKQHPPERPQPPPEVPRTMPSDYNRSRHGQYDAVIARLKQAELQARQNHSQLSQQ